MRPPPRTNSPKLNRQTARSDCLRQRCNDRHADEIIRFVRDIQFEKQPTFVRLQKKAPLPSIGKTCPKTGTSDSGFLERGTDSTDSDDDFLDNEIYTKRKLDPRDDPFIKNMLSCPRGRLNTSNDYEILSRSFPHGQIDVCNNNHRVFKHAGASKRSKKTTRGQGQTGKLPTSVAKQLPPLSRDDIPDRPSAPSPCRTPPTSDYSFIEEEPVDFLDLN